MPSPFPGMDPYIERPELWSDFQVGLAAEIRAELNKSIQPRYVARLVPREFLEIEYDLRLLTVEIIEIPGLHRITTIEVLSPSDKQVGIRAHDDYLRRRRELICSPAHLIEIDLLREGKRPPLGAMPPPAPYYVMVSREKSRPDVSVWPIQLADKLPTIPVPLSPPDPDVALDLGKIVSQVYEGGGYEVLIDYSQPPTPPLSHAESEWLDSYLREKKAR